MDKYDLFRKLLDFMAEESDITNALLSNWADSIEIQGKTIDGGTLRLEVSFTHGDP